jgi:hypothetical protein
VSYLRARDLIPTAGETLELLRGQLLQGQPESPFFLFAHFGDPHDPYRSYAAPSNPVTLELDGQPLRQLFPRSAPLVELELELSVGGHRLGWTGADDLIAPLSLDLSRAGVRLALDYRVGGIRDFRSDLDVAFDVPAAGKVDLRLWASDYPKGQARILRYAGEVMAIDRAVGDLLAGLREAGKLDDSLVIFTADHGEAFSEHGYNGHVEHLYDEMLHVPLIIRPPLGAEWEPVRAQLREDAERLFPLVDLAPTLLALMGREPLLGSEGRSHLDTPSEPGLLLAETHKPEASRDLFALRDERWKLILDVAAGTFELYDLEADFGEHTNVFAEHAVDFRSWSTQLLDRASDFERRGHAELDPESQRNLEALGY